MDTEKSSTVWSDLLTLLISIACLMLAVGVHLDASRIKKLQNDVQALKMESGVQRDQIVILHEIMAWQEEEIDRLRGEFYGLDADIDVLWDYTPIGDYVKSCLEVGGCKDWPLEER